MIRRIHRAALRAVFAFLALLCRVVPLFAQSVDDKAVPGRILRFDARLDQLIPPGAKVETVVTGRTWTEGPLWDRKDGSLLFSDVPENRIYRWREGQGLTVFLERSGYSGSAPFTGKEPGSNGLAIAPDGRLSVSEHGDRRVTVLDPDGTRTVVADRYQGKRFNSPNDHIWTPDGDLLITDPPFGLPGTYGDPGKETPFSGVYRRRRDGTVQLLTKELAGPNGIALTPEGDLVVSNNDPARPVWLRYPVRRDGSLGQGRVLFDATRFTRRAPGLPDGLKIDVRGNVFGAGPGGVYVIAPDGTLLGLIETGVATGNVAFGGEDGSVLYIAANHEIQRVRTATRGWR